MLKENSLIMTEMIMKPDAIAAILMPVEEAMNQKTNGGNQHEKNWRRFWL